MRSARAAVVPTLVAALALLAAPPAAGQENGEDEGHVPRSGFWLGGGLGGGVDHDGNGGGAAYFRLGGTLGPGLLLGGDVVGHSREVDVTGGADADLSRGNVTASLLLYPAEQGDFFVKGGLGFAYTELTQEQGDLTVSTDDTGLGLTLGAGYDVQLGDGNLFLTPNLDVLLQSFDGLEASDTLFLLTVGLGFR